ncbi:MAG: hypothetical protein V1903_13505 [Bacteroidota bacterium]
MRRKSLILFILAFYTLSGFKSDDGSPDRGVFTGGFIDITVESNINRVFFSYSLTGIGLYNDSDPETVNITVPVKDFRCVNETAFQDFLILLKADKYPYLSISIPQKSLTQNPQKEYFTIQSMVISIAGVSREYSINCRIENIDSGKSFLAGTLNIRLTDLGIEPPVKYFGLVKIENEVIVKFGFSINDYRLVTNKQQL